MYLKRIELVGFKSFAQKTVLNFPAGITAVVGPNGSGKTNVVESVRWLLGEREAKNMRSLKAEDLIFAGTPHKPRLGLAQATIVFDNKGYFFPVDFSEVTVRRRLERNGVSKYFLNDAEVRLKDIIDFFAKARLGTKGFSIVNQGDSDLFVRVTPKERRAMLEEILGLRQFQLKKHDAELKLKNTKFNMEKVSALIDEIMPHLRLLRRQTAKWEKHGDLTDKLSELENQYFGFKLKELTANYKKIEPHIKKLDDQTRKLTDELKVVQSELKKVGQGQPKAGRAFEDLQKEREELFRRRAELQKEIGRLEAKLEIAAEQPGSTFDAGELVSLLEEARENLQDILFESDLKTIKKLLKSLYDKINEVLEGESEDKAPTKNPAVSHLDSSREELFKEVSQIDEKLSSFAELEKKVSAELKDFNNVFRKAYEAVEKKKDEISSLQESRNKLLFERERIDIHREELGHQVSQAGRKLADFERISSDESAINSENIPAIYKKMLKLRGELATIGEIDESLIKEAKETEERYQFLSGQLKDLEKAVGDLTDLIKELDTKLHNDFTKFIKAINGEFHKYFKMMFAGGSAKLRIKNYELGIKNKDESSQSNENDSQDDYKIDKELSGIEIELAIPRKRITGLDMLSGGEKSLVSLAVLFALISVSPPPFLVLDEVDAALDEDNSKRFADLVKEFAKKTQFLIVTHNRATMDVADILYGVTMGEDGVSRVLSLKLES